MPRFNGKENIYAWNRTCCSDCCRGTCSGCVGNHRLPQEAEGRLVWYPARMKILMLTVTNSTRGITIGDSVELAGTSLSRMVGLLGRRGLAAGGGLWINPSSGVHTLGMAFSIDVVGLDRDLKVIKLWRCLPPFRITSVSLKMKSVLELPCGVISESQMQVGDQLHIATTPAESLAASNQTAS